MSTTTQFTTSPVDFIKDVRRNKENRDWDAFIKIIATGEEIYIGSGDRSWDAEKLCDEYVFNQLVRSLPVEEEPEPEPTPPAAAATPIASAVFCCRHCGADVVLDLSADFAGLYYQCINPSCQWAGEVDCVEALGLKENQIVTGTFDGVPVIGDVWYGCDDELDVPEVTYISMEWMGRDFSTDGRAWVTMPHGGDLAGDTSLAEYGWIKEATMAGVIDRLINHARGIVDCPLAQFPLAKQECFIPTPAAPAPVPPVESKAVYWSIDEWEKLGVDTVRTYLLEAERDGAEIHVEAALAYMDLAGGKAIWVAQIAIIKALGSDEWRRAVAALPPLKAA